MSFKGAIFDLDGVIVNTVPLHFAAWKYLFSDIHHIPFTKKDYEEKVDGKPRIDGVKAILNNLSEQEAIAAGEIKQQRYLQLLNEGKIDVFPSSVKLLKELIANKILIAAASSSKNARYILEKTELIKYFNSVISGNDFTHGKPHPEIFLKAAASLNLSPDQCIVFEDALAGVQAAKTGGFVCVGIDRHHQVNNYRDADLIVSDLAEVSYEKLKKLLN